jgi:hypothetical protein
MTTPTPAEPQLANRCSECHRPLRVFSSRLRHTGPKCAKWLARQRDLAASDGQNRSEHGDGNGRFLP